MRVFLTALLLAFLAQQALAAVESIVVCPGNSNCVVVRGEPRAGAEIAEKASYVRSAPGYKQSKVNCGTPFVSALVEKYAHFYGVDPKLMESIFRHESGCNPAAKSRVGATGVGQLMAGTARGLGLRVDGTVDERLDPEKNIRASTRLFAGHLKNYRGNVRLALAAYNAGGGAVRKYGGVPPYRETQRYVSSITAMYDRNLKREGGASHLA